MGEMPVRSAYEARERIDYLREQIELRAENAGYDRRENARLDKMEGELRGLEWAYGIDHEPFSWETPDEGADEADEESSEADEELMEQAEEIYAAFKSGEPLDTDDLRTLQRASML